MATTKTNRQVKALRQELVEIDLEYKECQERIKKERERMKELNKQKLEHKEKIRKLKERPVVWDDDTPLIELVIPWKMAAFKKMLLSWMEYSRAEINPDKTSHFDFDPTYKKNILSDLKSAMKKQGCVFKVSDAQVISYMSRHSSLGTFDSIKRAIQRLKEKKVGT